MEDVCAFSGCKKEATEQSHIGGCWMLCKPHLDYLHSCRITIEAGEIVGPWWLVQALQVA